mmetsp:Transcript_10928/g.23383  ORF Transcript_10928/g.23383 Transcript_10928/m.23383 type:complete len:297 (+) Transcript_10928:64-954(+)
MTVAILTLQKHRGGIWISELAQRLASVTTAVELVNIETAVYDPLQLPWKLVVNRVSDAAPPAAVKATLAVLESARLQGIPVINGTSCFAIGCNKISHHAVVGSVGLSVPKSRVCRSAADAIESSASLRYPMLWKPNSGGFGAGIVSLPTAERLAELVQQDKLVMPEDGMALLQEKVDPRDGLTYRVWVLAGKVQCAVQVVQGDIGEGSAGSCMCSAVGPQSWQVPSKIAEGVEAVMQACDADCGSVELLFAADTVKYGEEPLYFDVNMLSTLPSGDVVGGDPWQALADFVVSRVPS